MVAFSLSPQLQAGLDICEGEQQQVLNLKLPKDYSETP